MAAFFVRDPEIAAGLAPLLAMWSDPATPSAELREQMCQLMTKRAIDLRDVVIVQARIQSDGCRAVIGLPRRALQSAVPRYVDSSRQSVRAVLPQQFSRFCFQLWIATVRRNGAERRKRELELFKQQHNHHREEPPREIPADLKLERSL